MGMASGNAVGNALSCIGARGSVRFKDELGGNRMLSATQEPAFAGPLTGSATVWRMDETQVALHCGG